jgi:hypothetical protein
VRKWRIRTPSLREATRSFPYLLATGLQQYSRNLVTPRERDDIQPSSMVRDKGLSSCAGLSCKSLMVEDFGFYHKLTIFNIVPA